MIINHNIIAIDTCNKLNAASKLKNNAMEKLASGVRINKAADDAAGSSIDQKMKAQIRGLEQAGKNIQDGISLIQTADSGLGCIQNTDLQRMRELLVQASNGTLGQDDRDKIQNEIESIKASVNNIANSTQFNSINLLTPPSLDNYVPPKWTPGTADIVFIIDRTGSMSGNIDKVKDNIDGFINKIAVNGIDVKMGLVTYGDSNPSQGADSILKSAMTNDLNTFKSDLNNISICGGGDANESGLEGIADSTNGALSYTLRSDSAKQFILVTDAEVHDSSSDGGDGESSLNISDVANQLKAAGVKLTVIGDTSSTTETQLKRLSDPTGGDYLDIYGNFGDQLNTYASKILADAGCTDEVDTETMPTIQIQTGSTSNDYDVFKFQLFDARTANLGINDVEAGSIDEARASIDKVDNAMAKVSAQRGKFGAYQNRLEHIAENVNNYHSNLTDADSKILDTDMAKEIMEAAKDDIIKQSSESILKQAQNMQQSVSDLITKWQGGGQSLM